MRVRCPNCHNPLELDDNSEFSDIECPSCGSSFSLLGEQTATLEKSQVKAIGHFDLLDQVGVGAFGTVWKARDTQLDRTVAVKIPRKGQLDPSESEQFFREARSAAQLKHPNIVGVHEVGREDDQVFIVSDFVEGLPLSSWLTARQPTFREAAELCAKIAEALHHAHEAGVIHRDLKPSNVMLDSDGAPHIMDFGLAKREAGEVTMTMDGKVLGTPAYMSPEQAKGMAHAADRRTDVYSLGVILFELLTGEKPFRGDYRMLLHQVINTEAPNPRRLKGNVPRDLDTVCLKCLEKQPEKRYATAQQMAQELKRFLGGEPIHARPITAPDRVWRWCRRNPVVATLGSFLATVLVILGIGGPLVAIRQTKLAAEKAELAEENAGLATKERDARNDAEQQLRKATVTRLAAQAQAIRDELPVRSLLLAIEAVESTRRHDGTVLPVAYETLLSVSSNVGGRPLVRHEGRSYATPMTPDGRWLAAVGGWNTGQARLIDLANDDPEFSSRVLKGHTNRIWAAAISTDGRWLATGSADSTARLWDLTAPDPSASSRELPRQMGVNTLAISPDNHWLLTGGWEHTARLWDLSAPNPASSFLELRGHTERIPAVAISPDGQWAVTGSHDKSVRLWDLTEKDPASVWIELAGHEDIVRSVAISPDSRWLVTGSNDKTARLWDLKAPNPAVSHRVLRGHDGAIGLRSLAISSDSRWLVTGSNDTTARVWDLDSEDPAAAHRILRGHERRVSAVAISRDARWAFTGSADGTARVWDLSAKDPAVSPLVLRGHDGPVGVVALSPTDNRLLTGGWDGTVRLWDLALENPASALVLGGHQDSILAIANSPDNRWLVTASEDGTVRLRGLYTTGPLPVGSSQVLAGHAGKLSSVAMTNRWLVSGSSDGQARLWNLVQHDAPPRVFPGSALGLKSVAISRDDRWLVTGDHENTARLWDLSNPNASPRELTGYRVSEWSFSPIAISPDSRWLVTASSAGPYQLGQDIAHLWDLTAPDPVSSPVKLLGTNEGTHSLVISPDSRWLAVAQWGGPIVRLWELTAKPSADSTLELRGHGGGAIPAMAITPDSRRLVTVSFDKTARIWDLTATDPASSFIQLTGHAGALGRVVISPDGRWLVTGGEDGTPRVWDLTTEDPASSSIVLRGAEPTGASIAFSPDSRWVLTGGSDGTMRLWDLNTDLLVKRARQLAGRELTVDERKQYIIDSGPFSLFGR